MILIAVVHSKNWVIFFSEEVKVGRVETSQLSFNPREQEGYFSKDLAVIFLRWANPRKTTPSNLGDKYWAFCESSMNLGTAVDFQEVDIAISQGENNTVKKSGINKY